MDDTNDELRHARPRGPEGARAGPAQRGAVRLHQQAPQPAQGAVVGPKRVLLSQQAAAPGAVPAAGTIWLFGQLGAHRWPRTRRPPARGCIDSNKQRATSLLTGPHRSLWRGRAGRPDHRAGSSPERAESGTRPLPQAVPRDTRALRLARARHPCRQQGRALHRRRMTAVLAQVHKATASGAENDDQGLDPALATCVQLGLAGPHLAPPEPAARPAQTESAFGMHLHAATTVDGPGPQTAREGLPLYVASALRPRAPSRRSPRVACASSSRPPGAAAAPMRT